jgi:hypothetical protein
MLMAYIRLLRTGEIYLLLQVEAEMALSKFGIWFREKKYFLRGHMMGL